MDFIIMVVVGVFFFYLGWTSRERYAVRILKDFLEKNEEALEEKDETLIPITIEVHNDTFYVYSMNDNSFMAQGKTRKELEENLVSRYPQKHFAATTANLKEVGFIK